MLHKMRSHRHHYYHAPAATTTAAVSKKPKQQSMVRQPKIPPPSLNGGDSLQTLGAANTLSIESNLFAYNSADAASSTQNIIDNDQLDRHRRAPRSPRWLRMARGLKNPLILFLTPLIFAPLLSYGRKEYNCAYCVAVMAIYWITEALPLAITALMPIVMFPLTGVLSAKAVGKEYINDTNFLFIGGLIVATAVEKCDLHRRLALCVLARVGSKPQWIMLGFMGATAALSMFISNTATAAMMVPICRSVIDQLIETRRSHNKSGLLDAEQPLEMKVPIGTPRKPSKLRMTAAETKMAKALMISICFGANIGGTATITGTPPNLVLIGMLTTIFGDVDTGVHYLSWIAFAFPLMIICLLTCWAILLFMFLRGAPFSEDEAVTRMMKQGYASLPPMSFAEKSVAAAFGLLLAMWIGRDPQVVPGFGVLFPKGYFTDATSAVLVALLLFILPAEFPTWESIVDPRDPDDDDDEEPKKKKSNRLMDWEAMCRNFPWNIVLLLGGGFALATGVKESGLSEVIGQMLTGLAGLPSWTVQFVCIVVTMSVTNICSNTVAASIFLPIVANLAAETGVNPLALMLPTTIACSFAFVLPVGTPPNAIVFSSGMLNVFDMIISGLLISAATTLIVIGYMNSFALLIYPLAEMPLWANATTASGAVAAALVGNATLS